MAGHVTFEGQPVAGALVRLLAAQTPLDLVGLELRTTADGSFDFGLQPAMPHLLSASSPGKTAAVLELDLRDPSRKPDSTALELLLTGCEATLVGHVYDSAGGALEHAAVAQPGTPGATTNATGQFELCLPPGQNSLTIQAEGYGRLRVTALVLGRTSRDFRLIPAATVVGRVVMATDGSPVPGALVFAWPAQFTRGESPAAAAALSGPDGRFRIAVAPGDFRVTARNATAETESFARVTALVGRLSDEVTLRLRAVPTLRGRVMRSGEPVAGAVVGAILVSGSGHADAVSQVDGRFVMRAAPVGELAFTATPYSVLSPRRFSMPKADATVELEVKKQGSISGVVTSAAGKPVAGASVVVRYGTAGVEVVSGSDGHYLAAGLAAGAWNIVASSDRAGGFVEVKGVTLAEAEDKTLDLALTSAATITGRVVSEKGEPVPGALVVYTHTLSGDEGRSVADADGRFSCSQMTGGGEYSPKVYPSSVAGTPYAPAGAPLASVPLVDGRSRVEGVTLAIKYERLSIRGRVVDASGAPVPDARVRAMGVGPGEPAHFNQFAELQTAVADAQGAFLLEPLTRGTWALQARTPDGVEAVEPQVAAGQQDVLITVRPPGGIEGTLVGFEVAPVVYTRDLGGQGFAPALVEGNTFKASLTAGTYLVTAMNTKEGDAQRVEVKEGVMSRVTMTSHGHGVLEGTVVDHLTRRPMPGLTCHVVLAVDGRGGVTNWDLETAPQTNERGQFTADPSPAGDLQVSCFGEYSEVSVGAANLALARGGRAQVTVEVVRRLSGATPGDVGLGFAEELPHVVSVRAGAPASKASVAVGDVVVAVDGVPLGPVTGDGTAALIANHPPGSVVKLSLVHAGQPREVSLTTVGLGQEFAPPGDGRTSSR